MARRHEQHEFVAADDDLEEAGLRWTEGQRTEIEAPLLDFDGDLAGRNTTHVNGDVRHALSELRHQRQQRVDGGFVGADQHAPPAQVAQLAHRRLGLFGEPDQSLSVVLQDAAGVGQRAALRRAIEQLLPKVVLEPLDRLTDGRLRAVDLGGGARETAFLSDGQEDAKGGQIHKYYLL